MPLARRDATGVVVRILRDMLRDDTFTSDADVKEALKRRCARLRVPYDATSIHRALDLVASNRPLSTPRPCTEPESSETGANSPAKILEPPRDEASRVLRALRVAVRTVPVVRALGVDEIGKMAHDADRARALRLVLDAIADVDARLDALETEHEP